MGTHEYTNAIGELAELVRISKPEEILAYNRIIAEQDEYAIFSGKFLGDRPKKRDTVPLEEDNGSRRFKKHSLEWMLALARVEIGASLAMYGHIERAFEVVAPDQFGLNEFNMLVADDAAAHVSALESDDAVKKRVKKARKVDSDTVAYLRRIKVANDMVDYTARRSSGAGLELLNEMLRKLKKAAKELQFQAAVATMDYNSTESGVRTGVRQTKSTRVLVDGREFSPFCSLCNAVFRMR